MRDCPGPGSSEETRPRESLTGREHPGVHRPTTPAPPPSAPAFPDDIHACFRSQEAPFFMLPAFCPRSPSVSTESPRLREPPRRRVPDARAPQPRWSRMRTRSGQPPAKGTLGMPDPEVFVL